MSAVTEYFRGLLEAVTVGGEHQSWGLGCCCDARDELFESCVVLRLGVEGVDREGNVVADVNSVGDDLVEV